MKHRHDIGVATSMRARLSLSRNGFSNRFIVSCVGLCLGLIARSTFGPTGERQQLPPTVENACSVACTSDRPEPI